MTKEEARLSVMGAISMTLKDPILQQGFEIICKNLAELEKENAELRLKLEALEGQTPWKDIKDKSKVIGKLTEAKEHIKKLLDCLKQDTNDPQTNYYVCQYMDKAEQFLKDSEVKK